MSRSFTQKQIGDYLKANPFNVPVHFGDLDNMNGESYIFVDYIGENLVPSDNGGCYKTNIQITIYSKDFGKRKKLTDYVKGLTQFNISYKGSDEGNYFVTVMQSEVFLNGSR